MNVQVRRRGPHLADELGKELDRHALEGAAAQPAGRPGDEVGELAVGECQARVDRLRVSEEEPARRGERHGPWSAGPVEQPLADGTLKGGDLLADRCLGVAEHVCGTDEGALLGHGAKGGKVLDGNVLDGHKHKNNRST